MLFRSDALAISDQILDLDEQIYDLEMRVLKKRDVINEIYNEIKEMEDEKERLELGEDDESLCLQES